MQKNKTIRTTVRDTRKKVNHLSKVVLERKITADFTTSISSIRIDLTVLMMDFKVSKTNSFEGLIRRTSSLLNEVASKFVLEEEDGDR